MRTISISISHNNYTIIITIFNFKVSTNACPDCVDNCINFFILKISSRRAFSVLITLPRNGNIAWNLRSRPSFAEPPAESPSTKYNSFFSVLLCAGVNLPDSKVSLRLFSYLNEHLHELYVQLPCLLCFNRFFTSDLDNCPFLLNRMAICLQQLNQQHF